MAQDRRLMLHDILVDILGSENCYFSPPDNFEMSYPCIIYQLNLMGSNFADNRRYIKKTRYDITVIDEDPDSEIPDKILELQTAYFNTFFTSDNLNHWQFSLYF